MRFRAELSDAALLSGFLVTSSKFSKSVLLHLQPDVIVLQAEHAVTKAIFSARFSSTFFTEYRISSRANNHIMLCFDDISLLLAALRAPSVSAAPNTASATSGSTSSAASCSLRLAKESYGAVLFITVTVRGPDGNPLTIEHSIPTTPIAVDSPPISFPQLPPPALSVETPPSVDFKRAIGRFAPFSGDRMTLRADSTGALCVSGATVGVDVAAYWSSCTSEANAPSTALRLGLFCSATVPRDLFDAVPSTLAGLEGAITLGFVGDVPAIDVAESARAAANGSVEPAVVDVRYVVATSSASGCEVRVLLPVVASDAST